MFLLSALNIAILFSGSAVLLAIWVVYQRFVSPLSKFPGPFWASVTDLWKAKVAYDGTSHVVFPELHKRYGPFVRTGPNEVSVVDTKAFREIYSSGSKYRKSDYYGVWQGTRKFDMLAERNQKLYSHNRRMISHAYTMSYMRSLEGYVDSAIKAFNKRMEEFKGQTFEFGVWLQYFAFDVVTEVTFSKRYGLIEAGQDDGSLKRAARITDSGGWIGQIPWFFWLHEFLKPVIGNWLDINERHMGARDFGAREIQERRERGSDHTDVLQKLWETHEKNPADFEENDVLSMCVTNITAGADTTAITLRSIFYQLGKHPEVKQRLIEEIDSARSAGKLSDPVTFAEAQELPFLNAVIYESSRVHPSLGQLLGKIVPEEGLQTDEGFIPAGTIVGTSAWAMHQNTEIYGPDADQFNPDRWLTGDKNEMMRYFFSFSSGARTCMGKNIAMLEISKLVPTFLMRYDPELKQDKMEVNGRGMMVAQKGLKMLLHARDSFHS